PGDEGLRSGRALTHAGRERLPGLRHGRHHVAVVRPAPASQGLAGGPRDGGSHAVPGAGGIALAHVASAEPGRGLGSRSGRWTRPYARGRERFRYTPGRAPAYRTNSLDRCEASWRPTLAATVSSFSPASRSSHFAASMRSSVM